VSFYQTSDIQADKRRPGYASNPWHFVEEENDSPQEIWAAKHSLFLAF
jgi:hypothetical protein